MAYTAGKGKKSSLKRSTSACSACGARLQGVPNASHISIKRMAKSNRTPNRPYGGNMCVRCTRIVFKSKVV